MGENLDGRVPDGGTYDVKGRLGVKPLDDVSFTEHDKRLQGRQRSEVRHTLLLFFLTSDNMFQMPLNQPLVIGSRDPTPPRGSRDGHGADPHRRMGGASQPPGPSRVWNGPCLLPVNSRYGHSEWTGLELFRLRPEPLQSCMAAGSVFNHEILHVHLARLQPKAFSVGPKLRWTQ